MRVEDALRKIRLLRRVIPENGASEFEAETATRLVQALMERYSIGLEDVHAVASPRNRMRLKPQPANSATTNCSP